LHELLEQAVELSIEAIDGDASEYFVCDFGVDFQVFGLHVFLLRRFADYLTDDQTD
jgi:hypothetical protein